MSKPFSNVALLAIERELNKVIDRCLWKPSGDPDTPLLRRAAVAYALLKHLGLRVKNENDVVDQLRRDNAEHRDFLEGLLP